MKISEILIGDVLFVWSNSLIGEAIQHITHGSSHCALFISPTTLVEAQIGRTTGTIPLSYYLNSDSRLEIWRDESLTDNERKKMVTYAQSHLGIEYDYEAILMELIRFELKIDIPFHEGKRRICSSFVSDIAQSVNRTWSHVSLPAPVDLMQGGKLTKKGVLKNGN